MPHANKEKCHCIHFFFYVKQQERLLLHYININNNNNKGTIFTKITKQINLESQSMIARWVSLLLLLCAYAEQNPS